MRGKAAIVGIGATEVFTQAGPSAVQMAGSALKAALSDAGVSRDQVDGLALHVGPSMGGVDYDHLAPALGLNVRHVAQYWSHGRWITTTLQMAATTVACGLADLIAIVTPVKLIGLNPPSAVESKREAGGPHGQALAFGLAGTVAGAAPAARAYIERYGLDPDPFLPVVAAAHAHAARNPRVPHGAPFDPARYLAEPMTMDPLRQSDTIITTDAAVVVLVAPAEKARDYAKSPVYLRGMQGMRAGREEFIFAPRGLGVQQQQVWGGLPEARPRQVFEMAGLESADIDAFYCYDAFSPLVLFALERFGHCEPGQAARFAAEGQIAPGGRLPVNTSGGMLAEGYACGWHCIVELVRQLRGEAGAAQLPRAETAQWGTPWGDSVIFGSEP